MYAFYGSEQLGLAIENARLSEVREQIDAGKLADQRVATRVVQAARRLGRLALERLHRRQNG